MDEVPTPKPIQPVGNQNETPQETVSPGDLAKDLISEPVEEQPKVPQSQPVQKQPIFLQKPTPKPPIKKTKPPLPKKKKSKEKSRLRKSFEEFRDALASKSKERIKKFLKHFFSFSNLKHYIPKLIGYLLIFMGLIDSLGEPITNLLFPFLTYSDIAWIYLFIGVDIIGYFSIPLLLIHWKIIKPFGEYGEVYHNLFVCKDVSLIQSAGLNISLPCSTQILIFYVWLFTVLFLFAIRHKPFDKIVYTLAALTANYFYLLLMIIKVIALVVILLSSTTFGLLISIILAITVVTLDFIAINIALEDKKSKTKVGYSVN